MARILGNPFGEIRGKLAGNVFSRNKGGQILRGYVKPTNANTQAQISARALFSASMTSYSALDAAAKSAYNTFANTLFNSKKRGNVVGIHSGANAFLSLRNTLLNVNKVWINTPAILVNGIAATLVTKQDIVLTDVAPIASISSSLNYGDSLISEVIINNASAGLAGTVMVTLNLLNPVPAAMTSSIMFDAQNSPVGVNVYVSEPLKSISSAVQNKTKNLYGTTGLIEDYTVASATPESIKFTIPQGFVQADSKSSLATGQIHRFTAYLFDSNGQQIEIGSSTFAFS